jgi:hypothetical protein
LSADQANEDAFQFLLLIMIMIMILFWAPHPEIMSTSKSRKGNFVGAIESV